MSINTKTKSGSEIKNEDFTIRPNKLVMVAMTLLLLQA